jgi:hypothetical protein
MKIFTERDLILGVVARWKAQYNPKYYLTNPHMLNKIEILKNLEELDLKTATAQEVNAIIGNDSWITMSCHECGTKTLTVIQVGQEKDYESATANLCKSCLEKAYKLMIDGGC